MWTGFFVKMRGKEKRFPCTSGVLASAVKQLKEIKQGKIWKWEIKFFIFIGTIIFYGDNSEESTTKTLK